MPLALASNREEFRALAPLVVATLRALNTFSDDAFREHLLVTPPPLPGLLVLAARPHALMMIKHQAQVSILTTSRACYCHCAIRAVGVGTAQAPSSACRFITCQHLSVANGKVSFSAHASGNRGTMTCVPR